VEVLTIKIAGVGGGKTVISGVRDGKTAGLEVFPQATSRSTTIKVKATIL